MGINNDNEEIIILKQKLAEKDEFINRVMKNNDILRKNAEKSFLASNSYIEMKNKIEVIKQYYDDEIKGLKNDLKDKESMIKHLRKRVNIMQNQEENSFVGSNSYIEMMEEIEFLKICKNANETTIKLYMMENEKLKRDIMIVKSENETLFKQIDNLDYFIGVIDYYRELENYQKLKNENSDLQGTIKDKEYLLERANEEIDRLRTELAKARMNKTNMELIHNARGAGRKKNNEAMKRQMKIFKQLYHKNSDKESIMKEMGISQATYYRLRGEVKREE